MPAGFLFTGNILTGFLSTNLLFWKEFILFGKNWIMLGINWFEKISVHTISFLFLIRFISLQWMTKFLSSAYVVSPGPTCRNSLYLFFFLFFFLSVILYPIFSTSNWLTPWFLVVVLTYHLFRTLNPAIQELGWAMLHSDFLARLSSATLKIFISGVSSRILMP